MQMTYWSAIASCIELVIFVTVQNTLKPQSWKISMQGLKRGNVLATYEIRRVHVAWET